MKKTLTMKNKWFVVLAVVASLSAVFTLGQQKASAACAALPTDKGTVTQTISVPANGTYRVWSRMLAPDTTNNEFYMQIDQTLCSTAVGGGTSISANTWTWVDYMNGTSASKVNVTLTAGSHTITMAGKDANVQVDRVILTAVNTDGTTCSPNNTAVSISGVNYYGENCAPTDITAPVVTLTSPANNATVGTGGATTVTISGAVTDASTISNISAYLDGSTTAAASDTTPSTGTYSITLSLSGLASGSAHTLVVKATDADGNVGSSGQIVFTKADTVQPNISAISSSNITQNTASIKWTTDEASSSQVEYGTTTSYGSSSSPNTTMVTAHDVSLTGLTAGTTYHYRVKSNDAAGNPAVSGDNTFTTSPFVDSMKPTVSLTAPAASAQVSGTTVTISANATDNVAVAGVQFTVDDASVGAEDTSFPYSVTWNTTSLPNGTHTIKAIARDTSNLTQTTSITVTISNPTFRAEDINQDGKVNELDYSLLIAKWGQTTNLGRTDINGDGSVGVLDFSLLVSQYGR